MSISERETDLNNKNQHKKSNFQSNPSLFEYINETSTVENKEKPEESLYKSKSNQKKNEKKQKNKQKVMINDIYNENNMVDIREKDVKDLEIKDSNTLIPEETKKDYSKNKKRNPSDEINIINVEETSQNNQFPSISSQNKKESIIKYPSLDINTHLYDTNIRNINTIHIETEESEVKTRQNTFSSPSLLNFNLTEDYFIVSEKEIIKELIGSYINYSLSIKDTINNKLLSERRYSDFDFFHSYMISKYPFHLIPKLIEKSITSKIFLNDESKETRKKQLSYYLNFIKSHPFLSKTKEFELFVSEPRFNSSYFSSSMNKEESNPSFPISDSLRNKTISKKLLNVISYIGEFAQNTIGKKTIDSKDQNEKRILDLSLYFNKIIKDIKQVQTYMLTVLDSTKQVSDCYQKLGYSFLFLKETVFSTDIVNEVNDVVSLNDCFEGWSKVSEKLENVMTKLEKDDGNNLKDKLEGYVSIVNGVIELINRYYSYVSVYDSVKNVMKDSSLITDKERNGLNEEYKQASEYKVLFEKRLISDVGFYFEKYHSLYYDILSLFLKYLRTESNTQYYGLRKV